MKSLLRLGPYFRRYKKKLLLGLLVVAISNVFTVSVPSFARAAIDALSNGSATPLALFGYGALTLMSTVLAG